MRNSSESSRRAARCCLINERLEGGWEDGRGGVKDERVYAGKQRRACDETAKVMKGVVRTTFCA